MSSRVCRLQFQSDVQKLCLAAEEESVHVLLCIFNTQSNSHQPEINLQCWRKIIVDAWILWHGMKNIQTYTLPSALCWSVSQDTFFCLPSQNKDKDVGLKELFLSFLNKKPLAHCGGAVRNVSGIKEGETLLAAEAPAPFTPNVLLQANSQYFFVSVLLRSVIMFLAFLGYAVMEEKMRRRKIEFSACVNV